MIADMTTAVGEYAPLIYAVLIVGLVLATIERGISWLRKGANR